MFVFRGDGYVTCTSQCTLRTRKSALIYRRGLRQRVASLTLDCNVVFAIKAYGSENACCHLVIKPCTASRKLHAMKTAQRRKNEKHMPGKGRTRKDETVVHVDCGTQLYRNRCSIYVITHISRPPIHDIVFKMKRTTWGMGDNTVTVTLTGTDPVA